MKITLNRKEMHALKEFANTIDSIQGLPDTKYFKDFKVSKKAYVMAMVTGELTIEVRPEMVSEFLELSNDFAIEVAPFMTALIGLYRAMAPACNKYDKKFEEFFNKYRENSFENHTYVTSEPINNSEEIKEVI